MSKITARNASIYLDTVAGACTTLSGELNQVTLRMSNAAPELTPFGNTTAQRMAGGLVDYELSCTGYTGTGAAELDAFLNALKGSSTVWIFGPSGSGTDPGTCPAYNACGVLIDYDMGFTVNDAATMSFRVRPFSGSVNREQGFTWNGAWR